MCTCFNLNSNLFLRKKRRKDLVESKLLFASLTWMVTGTLGEKMERWDRVLDMFMKNMSCTKQTLRIASLIEAKLSPFWL